MWIWCTASRTISATSCRSLKRARPTCSAASPRCTARDAKRCCRSQKKTAWTRATSVSRKQCMGARARRAGMAPGRSGVHRDRVRVRVAGSGPSWARLCETRQASKESLQGPRAIIGEQAGGATRHSTNHDNANLALAEFAQHTFNRLISMTNHALLQPTTQSMSEPKSELQGADP
eukprot:306833-Chlamydomonas_euryale.AAC.9